MYNQIDYATALQYSDKISELSTFYTIQENKSVLYLFEEKFNQLVVHPQYKAIANCKDGSLLIEDNQYKQLEAERILAKMKIDLGRNNKLPLEKIYKNLYQKWIDVFQRLIMEVDFHFLVATESIYQLDNLLNCEGVEFPENFTDILGLCKYVSTIVLEEEFNSHLEDTEDFVELDEFYN